MIKEKRPDPRPPAESSGLLPVQVAVRRQQQKLRQNKLLILAAAATAETHHIIGATELSLLPCHAVLVNIARGALLDQDALVVALNADQLWGAGLDVSDPEPLPADHPLWQIPRCVITSHSADTPLMTAHLLGTRIERNVRAFLAGTPFIGIVDARAGY